jgi:arylsulfatase A-like enzyme
MAAAALPCSSTRAQDAKSAPRPNVVLMMADDLGWGDVGFNGSEVARTPHLDEMARNGLLFRRFYAGGPVCSPTRGTCLTGRHHLRYGIPNANSGHMLPGEITLAEALRTRGYATGHFGKWHLGTLTRKSKDANRGGPRNVEHYATPAMHGFDVYFSTESKVPTFDPLRAPRTFGEGESLHYGWRPVAAADSRAYGTHYWDGEEHAVTENTSGDDSRVIVDRAAAFIERAAKDERPFLAVVWFHAAHLPVVAGEEHRALYADRDPQEQLYFGCITALDEQVGRIRETLRTAGVAENTLLWFASDNGPERGTPGSAGPFRERKRSVYEGGVRVPAILEWPARIPTARVTDAPAVTSDYYPTMLDLLDLEMPGQPGLDGTSLRPLIEGSDDWQRPRPIGFRFKGDHTWSDNRFKLVALGGLHEPELYDLPADPGEQQDVAAAHPEVVEQMLGELRAWSASVDRSATGADYE